MFSVYYIISFSVCLDCLSFCVCSYLHVELILFKSFNYLPSSTLVYHAFSFNILMI